MSDENKLSRRDFIKEAAVGAAAVAGAGALGALGATPAAAQTPAGLPAKWDKEVDVVVAGTGGAGLSAAIEAATGGAEVLLVERGDHVGGLFTTAGGGCTIGGGTIVQQRAGVKDDLDSAFDAEMWASDYRAVPELVRTYVKKGPDTVLWMEKLGLVWKPLAAGTLAKFSPIWRGLQPDKSPNYPGTFGHSWITVLLKEVNRLKVPILLKHRLTRIYRDGTGPVVGIEVKTEAGTINIKARKAVVVCTGGFTDNVQMCMSWDRRLNNDTFADGDGPGGPYVENTGDGILAAEAIGAALTDMSYVCHGKVNWGTHLYFVWEPRNWVNPPVPPGGGLAGVGLGISDYQRVICVKADGARYVNEWLGGQTIERKVGIDPYAPSAMAPTGNYPEHPFTRAFLNLKENPRNVWAITDADGAAALKWPEATMRKPDPKVAPSLYPDSVAVADTLAQLASMIGIPAAALDATVKKYNGFVDAGEDKDFGKPKPLYKLAKPPFFAARFCYLRHTQRNGLRINTKGQVIDRFGLQDAHTGVSIDAEKVIPHLYAGGESAAFLGWRRPHNTLGHYVSFGRIAGENAAKEKV